MNTLSLKKRFLALQILFVTLALLITGYGLTQLFERHVERRINAELATYLTRITAIVGFDNENIPYLKDNLADPRFEKVFGGLYWQIDSEAAKHKLRSRSLWDYLLVIPQTAGELGQIGSHIINGPAGSKLLVLERRLAFDNGGKGQELRLIVAIDQVELQNASAEFASEVAVALLALGTFLLIAGWIQITIGLRPLAFVRNSIAAVRTGKARRVEVQLPDEVSPLAEELNNLLVAQEATILKAKNRADNLAHGLKTPLTALIADVRRLRDLGQNEIADDIEAVTKVFRRQIERELTTSRIRRTPSQTKAEILPIIEKISATLKRTPDGENKKIHISCPHDMYAAIDGDDLTEILGNLFENAFKHARSLILVNVEETDGEVQISIEDDGKGISDKLLETVQKRGVRLDQSSTGTGIGLAIVNDILEIYGSKLQLGSGKSGGLMVKFKLNLPTPE